MGGVMNEIGQDKERNRKIAANEAERQVIGDARVSVWAVAFTIILAVIAVGIVWMWLNR
jgi:hypothetical protein